MSCCVVLFLPVFSVNGNLAYNATRFSLSNEPFYFNEIVYFLVSKMCLYFLLSSMHITHLHKHTLHFQET
jgi:cellulose synthase/poly-beta-1,6-N-acetylglucosamine synthase-like glycosyltransferase